MYDNRPRGNETRDDIMLNVNEIEKREKHMHGRCGYQELEKITYN